MRKARTQLDDLRDQLKDCEGNIKYCEYKGIQGSKMHTYLINKRHEIVSTINNIR